MRVEPGCGKFIRLTEWERWFNHNKMMIKNEQCTSRIRGMFHFVEILLSRKILVLLKNNFSSYCKHKIYHKEFRDRSVFISRGWWGFEGGGSLKFWNYFRRVFEISILFFRILQRFRILAFWWNNSGSFWVLNMTH